MNIFVIYNCNFETYNNFYLKKLKLLNNLNSNYNYL